MQNAKDSFYMALRARLVTINPERTICCAARCGRESLWRKRKRLQPASQRRICLRWLGLGVDMDLASTMAAEECEILYQTCGTQSFGGLDRGRSLSEMDEEVIAMIQPFCTPKLNYIGHAAGGDADAGVLGRAGIHASRSAARPAEPLGKGDGLQLPGAGGVNGSELVFGSRAGRSPGARVLCAGESAQRRRPHSSIRPSRVASTSILRRLRGSAWAGFRTSPASR